MFTTLEYLPLITDLPWHRFTLRHIGIVYLLHVFIIVFSFYLIYSALHPEKGMGRLLMKVPSSEANYPFYFGLGGWLLLLSIIIGRIGRDFALYLQWDLPLAMTEDMMMRSAVQNTLSFVTYFFLGIAFLIGAYSRLEIREKGLRTGGSFIPWQNIIQLEWIDPVRVRIYYQHTSRWKKSVDEPVSVLWEIKPEEAPEARKVLEEQLIAQEE